MPYKTVLTERKVNALSASQYPILIQEQEHFLLFRELDSQMLLLFFFFPKKDDVIKTEKQ